jgi:predicted GNAT family acetyltransferase
MSAGQIDVVNNSSASRYEATLDGELGYAEYQMEEGRIIFPHTVVPPAIEGQGVASELARVALDDARAKGLKVVPYCAFFIDYIEKHPEYQDLVAS